VYVKMSISLEGKKPCDCKEVKILQIVRQYTRLNGQAVPWESKTRNSNSGWAQAALLGAAVSQPGWMLDILPESTDPYYGDHNIGTPKRPTTYWDAPGLKKEKAGFGREFYTIAICSQGDKDEKRKILGYIHWMHYNTFDGKIQLEPLGVGSGAPNEVSVKSILERTTLTKGSKAGLE
jgi:hypothetical protein